MARKRLPKQTDEPIFLDWADIGPPGPLPVEHFLKLRPGFTAHVRLFHRPVRYGRVVTPGAPSRLVPYVTQEERPLGTIARYAINVIDRTDGQIKTLEDCEALFVQFRRATEISGVDLGGPDGFDLAIEVAGEGVGRKYRVSFNAECRTPFTPTEKEHLRTKLYPLPTKFKPS